MNIINSILDFVFPVDCISCGKKGDILCVYCLSEAQTVERESLKWVFPLYDYRDPTIKKAIWLLKYKNKRKIAEIFSRALYENMLEELSEMTLLENFHNPILIPIPLAPKRKAERGFNQSELLCRNLIKLDLSGVGHPTAIISQGVRVLSTRNFTLITSVLIKPKDTIHQAHIHSRRQRLENLVGSFSVKNTDLIKNRNIILIDDITTTGATLSEAKKVLREHGAKKIIAFTIAH